MLVRLRSDVINLCPKIVVILADTNDIAGNTGQISLETIVGNIMSMAEIARSNQIQVIIASVLPTIDFPSNPGLNPASKIVQLNQLLENYCISNGIVFLDYYPSLVDNKGGLKIPEYTSLDDLVHSNKKRGYQIMEKLALPIINNLKNSN